MAGTGVSFFWFLLLEWFFFTSKSWPQGILLVYNFPAFFSQNGIFYKQLVASGNFFCYIPAIPVIPAIPAIPVKWGRRVRRGPSLPHAPGARMTVVHTNSLKLQILSHILSYILSYLPYLVYLILYILSCIYFLTSCLAWYSYWYCYCYRACFCFCYCDLACYCCCYY